MAGFDMVTIGEKLAEARENSGLSIEDVAHETHIHPATIQNIEVDDFSTFPSVAYAKSFIKKYADFLEVDLSVAMQALNSGFTVRLGENELMDEMKNTIKKDRRFRLERSPKTVRRKLEKPGGAPILLNLILAALIAALGVFYFLGFNAATLEEAKMEISKGLQKAIPFSEEEPGSLASAEIPDELNFPKNPLAGGASDSETKKPTLKKVDLTEKDQPALPAPTSELNSTGAVPVADPVPAAGVPAAGVPAAGVPAAGASVADANIAKPDVDWKVDESKPRPLARKTGEGVPDAPAVRKTPNIKIEADFTPPPIQSVDLPAVRKLMDEPAAVLRPEGTDPAKRVRRAGETADSGSGNPATIRAVPVARTR